VNRGWSEQGSSAEHGSAPQICLLWNGSDMRMSHFSLSFIVFVLMFGCSQAPEEPAAPKYEATWDSLRQHNPAPDWFRDAKYSIYFHWGVYSVPAYASEWYPRLMLLKGQPAYEHHVKKYGDPSEFGYHGFVPMFKAEKFNAEEWADLFQQAGALFAGPVAEHHDGFSMWASKVNPWNVGDKGPRRDITGELETAIRARGMKFVATFHHARNLNESSAPASHNESPETTNSG
jgi:alpha-L-fucosidase